MLQPILIDSSVFKEMRDKGGVYVDKTAYLHRLISGINARYFIARPRRFGKSLMITTLKAIFEGRRELFEGLAISRTDWEWEKFPVLYFDFSLAVGNTAERFERNFNDCVRNTLANAGVKYDSGMTPEMNLGMAIDSLNAANKGKGVVVLIDEYDAPVAHLLAEQEEAKKARELLSAFYLQLKPRTDKIRFLMITGVSKFTKMSVFSALSNLVDISFNDNYATMLGYTEEELDQFFSDHIQAHAELMRLDNSAYRAELKRWFNGYRFGKFSPETVYNPVSIGMNLFEQAPIFQSCWSSTGKASMLMNFLKRDEFLAVDMECVQGVLEQDFDVTDIAALRPVPMLFQTGYLTIGDFSPATRMYSLRVPDEEVRRDLATLMTAVAADRDTSWGSSLGGMLLNAQWDEFFDGLKALYASLPYGAKEGRVHEHSFERCLAVLLKSQGIQCVTEARQADGQADIVAVHACGVFIFELKVDAPAETALAQVRAKGYDAPYRGRNLPIWLVGLCFDRATRQLADARAERLS